MHNGTCVRTCRQTMQIYVYFEHVNVFSLRASLVIESHVIECKCMPSTVCMYTDVRTSQHLQEHVYVHVGTHIFTTMQVLVYIYVKGMQ